MPCNDYNIPENDWNKVNTMNDIVDKCTRVFVVDDHPIVRQGIRMILEEEGTMEVCGESGNANDAIRLISNEHPDIVLVDISLEGTASGIDLVGSLKKRFPSIPCLIISMHDDSLYAERAIMAGARGYVMKNEMEDVIVSAINTILNGELYLKQNTSLKIVSKLLHGSGEEQKSSIDSLTDREFDIFRLLGQGFGTRKIANKLNISVNTVETHRRNIKKKLDLHDSDELVMYAIRWGMESSK